MKQEFFIDIIFTKTTFELHFTLIIEFKTFLILNSLNAYNFEAVCLLGEPSFHSFKFRSRFIDLNKRKAIHYILFLLKIPILRKFDNA